MGGYTCPISTYKISGKLYQRIPFLLDLEIHTCNDCGIAYSNLHHPGCDLEECPKCHQQAIACGCRQVPVPLQPAVS